MVIPFLAKILLFIAVIIRTFLPMALSAIVLLLYRVHHSLTFLERSREERGPTSQQSRRQC